MFHYNGYKVFLACGKTDMMLMGDMWKRGGLGEPLYSDNRENY